MNRNAVSFAVYLSDGRLLLQFRGLISPEGSPVSNGGMLSINGGQMDSEDQSADLLREMYEELGIQFNKSSIGQTIRYLGDVADLETGRSCHVHRLTVGYDELLATLPASDIVKIMINPEGIGRVAVWRDDLDILIAQGRLTPISVEILRVMPDLLPPPQPVIVS